jgi:para-aminobenzoate synthetase component 1
MKIKKIKLDPIKFFQKLNTEKGICFLKSNSREGWGTIIAFNPACKFSYKTGEKNNFSSFLKQNTKKGRKLIGYFSYDIGYELHRIKKTAKDDLKLPDIYFYAFDNYITFKDKTAEIHYKDQRFPEIVYEINRRKTYNTPAVKNKNFTPTVTKKQYEKAYRKIKKYIFEGDIYQINLTHRLEAKTTLPSRNLFTKVIEKNPVDYLAYIESDHFQVLSASPERFVKVKNRKIETCPIKGTRPRGKTEKSDQRYRKELLENKKEAAELNMITDLLRNDLGKVCEIGSVKVAGSRLISKCPTVWHTYSKITGKIAKKFTPVDAMISMLPGGSITGCPKKHAMEIIDELEPTTRSIYTGIIGHIDPNLDLDFNIAIRTIIKKNDELYLQVGGGIVHDSVEKAEFKETLDKAKSFMKILL